MLPTVLRDLQTNSVSVRLSNRSVFAVVCVCVCVLLLLLLYFYTFKLYIFIWKLIQNDGHKTEMFYAVHDTGTQVIEGSQLNISNH